MRIAGTGRGCGGKDGGLGRFGLRGRDEAAKFVLAQRTGATAVIVPENTDGAPNVHSYFDLMNAWVNGLAQAFTSSTGTR